MMNKELKNTIQDEKGFIKKKPKGSGPFEDLYLEGLQMLQNLSGNRWTDYNLHDPGVTILENVIYGLTNLSLQSEQPIIDLLVQGKGEQLESGDNGFFIPSEILTTNPVTINDYRKIMIDQIVNLKNTWFELQNELYSFDNQKISLSNLKGLYHIYVELHRYPEGTEASNKEEERIKNEVKKLYHSHRNLCEDLFKVTILKPLELHIELKLTITDLVNGDEILAEIFYKIRNHISLDPKFRSLWELRKEKVPINTIFNGPHLENGFIEDDQLNNRIRIIYFSDLVSMINKFEHIISVDYFDLHIHEDNYNDPNLKQTKRAQLTIPLDYAPILEIPHDKSQLSYRNAGISFTPDLEEVKKKLSYIEAKNYGSFKSVSKSFNRVDIPNGREPHKMNFYPLRKQFPPTYGIGDYGLSSSVTDKRKAQVAQLKGYLLPFDQLMVNFLAQLTNIYRLYEVDGDDMQSYFFRELEDMPELTDLIRKNENQTDEKALLEWKKVLANLNQSFDQKAVTRLNDIADSLLARFGETFPDYALRKMHKSLYSIEEKDNQLEKKILQLKQNLIRDYAQLSYNRAKAFDYTQAQDYMGRFSLTDDTAQIIPGLIIKISLLLGISNMGIKSFTKIVEDAEIKIYNRSEGATSEEHLEIIYTDEKGDYLEFDDVVIIDDQVSDLHGAFYFYGNEDKILPEVLKYGVNPKNYEIKSNNGKHHPAFYILFKKGTEKSRVAHITHTYREATRAIENFINRLKKVNEESEGFFMIEHLLLAPPYESASFGYEFSIPLKKDVTIKFLQHELSTINARNEDVAWLKKHFKDGGKIQFKSIKNRGNYEVQILSDTGTQLAVSEEKFYLRTDSESIVNQMELFVKKISEPNSNLKIDCKAYYGNNCEDEYFFSHSMSFVLPSWPARFQAPNFKRRFHNVVLEEYPAHIAFDTIWLDFDEMKIFEENYFKWLNTGSIGNSLEARTEYSYKLIQILKKYFLQPKLTTA